MEDHSARRGERSGGLVSPKLKILYVGRLGPGETCLQRMIALEDLGHDVTGINAAIANTALWWRLKKLPGQISYRLFRMGWGPFPLFDVESVNKDIRCAIRDETWDVLWIDKGLTVYPGTLRQVKRRRPDCRIVGYSPDDMYQRRNQSKQFLQDLPWYDVFFTTKSYNVKELESLGCPRVLFIENGFDPRTHRPIALTPEERSRLGGALGFVGSWEEDRESRVFRLAEAGFSVRVRGAGWKQCRRRHPNVRLELVDLYGDDYAKAICASDINLCFLRKANRDLQTTRSIEIPACGAFMLAERTDEHRQLFEEGREAEFFASDDELVTKARYYCDHPEERNRIAVAGRQRCLASGYSNQDRLKAMLLSLAKIRPGAPAVKSGTVRAKNA